MSVRADASYLVTGGYGGLGLVVARWLADRGARTIALLGRHPAPASEAVRAMEAMGVRVVALAGDVADAPVMTAHLARFGADLPPLAGIVHAAASFSAAPIGTLSDADVRAMLRPKMEGTMLLESLTRARPPEWMVLFSSTTALLGAAGFAHYAAANAFLDASARAARRAGRATTSIDWGTWEVMRLVSAQGQQSYRESGLEPLGASEALDAMSRAVAAGQAESVVARIDWATLKPLHEARRRRPFLSRITASETPAIAAATANAAAAAPAFAASLAALPALARHDALVELVSREVSAVLGIEPGRSLARDVGLFEMGMDSLMSVELRKRLERGSGLALPSTLTFNYPNVDALAGFLATRFDDAETPAATIVVPPTLAVAVAPRAGEATSDVAALSDAELEARLLARLEALR
jgi:NAD(P)-dependent dehydrogenase (short-subunit alcohol dehydrogenase family)/acyl carrier protein